MIFETKMIRLANPYMVRRAGTLESHLMERKAGSAEYDRQKEICLSKRVRINKCKRLKKTSNTEL